METTRSYARPVFEDCLAAWKTLLAGRGLATELVWILEENLCFERDRKVPGGFRLGFQTQFTQQPAGAAKDIYHHFAETDERVVFYRLGSNRGRSICLELCDEWFEPKGEAEGYVRRDDWLVSFYPGGEEGIEEITDPRRWQSRVMRGRPLSAVDFCMTLAALRELKAHGRVLTPDERFGLSILRSMHRIKAGGKDAGA